MYKRLHFLKNHVEIIGISRDQYLKASRGWNVTYHDNWYRRPLAIVAQSLQIPEMPLKKKNFLHLQGSGLAEKLAQVPFRGTRLIEYNIYFFTNSLLTAVVRAANFFCAKGGLRLDIWGGETKVNYVEELTYHEKLTRKQ